MAIEVVASFSAATPDGLTFTTSPVDTTGADLIIVAASAYAGALVLTDSESNTWTDLTLVDNSGIRVRLRYCVAPVTDAAQTFTLTSLGPVYASIHILAVSGAHASPFVTESAGATVTGTSIQPGSLTPPDPGCLLITGVTLAANGTISINSGYSTAITPYTSGINMGGGIGWLIQGASAAVNPTWSFSGAGGDAAAAGAVFLPAEFADPVVAGATSLVSSGPDGIEIESPAATGGTAPYTYQRQRNADGGSWSDLTDGGGVTGATALLTFDGSAVVGTQYRYRIVATDDDAVEDTGDESDILEVYDGGAIGSGAGFSIFGSSIIRGDS